MTESTLRHREQVEGLRQALKASLHVMEKGMEVRMQDRWPGLKIPLDMAILDAKLALQHTGDGSCS